MKLREPLATTAVVDVNYWRSLVEELASAIGAQLGNLNSRWTLYQAVIIIIAFYVAKSAAGYLEPRLEEHLRKIKGQPALLRILVILLRRIDLMLLASLLAIAGTIILQSTWPSNAYILRLAAHLTIAFAVVSTISRLIRNRLLQLIFSVVGWTIAALSLLGWLEPTVKLLDDTSLTLGSSRLSLLIILKSGILLVVLVWLANVLGDFLERRINTGLELSPAMQVLAGKLIRWGLIGIAILTALGAVGVDLTALTVLSGAIGIGIGFGLQKLASNLISGVIILTDRSIKPGDTISIGDMRGTISSLHARYVSVQTLTGAELLVPNETFVTETVVNWSYSNRRMLIEIPFGVDYGSDPNEVREIAIGVARSVKRVLSVPAPNCQLRAFGDSSLDMALLFWIDDPENGLGNVKSEIMFGLWAAFKERGIEIPFPHRELIIKQQQSKPTLASGHLPV